MVKIHTFSSENMQPRGLVWIVPFIIGASLVLFGILIVIMPELLAVIVAAGIVFAGVSLLLFSLRLRNSRQKSIHSMFKRFDI